MTNTLPPCPAEIQARPIHLLVDPSLREFSGIATYCHLAAPLIEAALGRNVRIIKRRPDETFPDFRQRLLTEATRLGGSLAEVEAPESGASTLLLPLSTPLHIRLHLGRTVGAYWEGRDPDPTEVAMEQAVLARAMHISAPSWAAVAITKPVLTVPGNFSVYPNPAPHPNYTPRRVAAPAPYLSVVVVARAQKLKGADLLPEIAVRLPPRTRLHLVGYQTEGLAKRLTETRRTPSGGSIIGHGEYAPSLVRGFIKNADVVLVPSVVETFSMVAAEAVALGRPVAAWDHIGATEAAPACFHTAPAWDFQALADAVGCAYATPMAADPSPWEQAAARMRLSFSAGATAASQDIRRRRQGLVSAMCDALPRPDPLHPASPVTSRHRRLFRKLVASPRTFLCDSAPAKAAARLIAAPRT